MKLGIDARPLQGETQYRGIGKAMDFFLHALLPLLDPDTQCVFYVDEGLPLPTIVESFPARRIIYISTSKIGRMKYIRSFLPSYRPIKPSLKDIDVLLQYDASLGVPKSVPTVTMFHDLIPYLFRSQEKRQNANGLRKMKNFLARELYWNKYLRFLGQYKKSKKILAISQSSLDDLKKYVKGVENVDATVTYLGVMPLEDKAPVTDVVRQISKNPYLLYVGGIDLRKNIVGLLGYFYELKAKYPKLQLVTVGKEFELNDQLNDLGWNKLLNSNKKYAKDVICPGFLSGSDLAYLYSHASAFTFPSRYEGFGLPVLEAMQAGCPVVAYDNSSIPEVAGDAALLVKDGESLVPSIVSLLEDKKLRDGLIEKGVLQAKKFSWQNTAKQTIKTLRECTKESDVHK